MRNIKLVFGLLILAGFLFGFTASKKAIEKKHAHEEAEMLKVLDAHALDALSISKTIVSNRRSSKSDLRKAIYNLSEASMHSSQAVKNEANDVLQVAVRKLQQADPDGFNINIYYKYLDNIEVFVNDYDLNQPFVSATDANGKEVTYPYLMKGEINFSDVSKSFGLNSHVLELEIPGTKEKTRLYIDAGDFKHSEFENQRNHQHYIIDPVK